MARAKAKPATGYFWAFFALWVVLAVVHGWSLMHFPMITEDEGWYAGRAWTFIKTSYPFSPLDVGVIDRTEGYWSLFPWFPVCLQSLAIRFLPVPSVFPMRLLSLILGFALLYAVYQIGKRLYGLRAGFIAVLLTGFSWSFFLGAHYARLDIITASLDYGALALMLCSDRFPFLLNTLSGLCVAVAFEGHPYGALFGPCLLAMHIFQSRRKFLREPKSAGFAVGIAIGLFFFYLRHLWLFPKAYFDLAYIVYGPTHQPPLFSMDWKKLLLEIFWSITSVRAAFSFAIWLVVFAFYLLLKRRSYSDRLLVIFLVVYWALFTVIVTNKLFFYIILWSPGINLLLAALLAESIEKRFPKTPLLPWSWTHPLRAGMWAVVGGYLLLQMPQIQTNLYDNYNAVLQQLHEVIKPTDRIMASQSFWPGFYQQEYYSWEQLVWYHRYYPGTQLEEAMDQFRPDIFIIDGHVAAYISDENGSSLYSKFLRIPKTELQKIFEKRGRIVKAFPDAAYGMVYVVRLDWGDFPKPRTPGSEVQPRHS